MSAAASLAGGCACMRRSGTGHAVLVAISRVPAIEKRNVACWDVVRWHDYSQGAEI